MTIQEILAFTTLAIAAFFLMKKFFFKKKKSSKCSDNDCACH